MLTLKKTKTRCASLSGGVCSANLFFLLLFIVLFATGCRSEKKDSAPEYEYDIYEVRVRSSLAVRSQPNRYSTKIADLYNHTQIRVTGIENGWAQIIVVPPDSFGYVSGKYIEFMAQGPRISRESAEKKSEQADEKKSEQEDEKKLTEADAGKAADTDTESEASSVASGSGNVLVEDSAGIFSDDEIRKIKSVGVPDGWTFAFVTTDSVPYMKLLDYNEDTYDRVKETLPKKERDNLVVVSYVAGCRLVNYSATSSVSGYVSNFYRDDFSKIQYQTGTDSVTAQNGILMTGDLLKKAVEETKTMSWYKRWRLTSSCFIDEILDTGIVNNMLPRDSFMHKYVFSWMMKLPFATARWLIDKTMSIWMSMALTALIMILVHFIFLKLSFSLLNKPLSLITINFGRIAIYLYCLAMLVAFLLYILPSMANVDVMALSGKYSGKDIANLLYFYGRPAPNIGWGWYLLFFCLAVGNSSLDVNLLPKSFLRRDVQLQDINARISGKSVMAGIKGIMLFGSESRDKILNSENPYGEIYSGKAGEAMGKMVVAAGGACFVFNGTLVIYGIMTFGVLVLCSLVTIIMRISFYHKQRLT